MFSEEEISRAEDAFDLLSRVKRTDQTEMIATVLFSYDGIAKNTQPTEQQVYDHVMNRKPQWRGVKDLRGQVYHMRFVHISLDEAPSGRRPVR